MDRTGLVHCYRSGTVICLLGRSMKVPKFFDASKNFGSFDGKTVVNVSLLIIAGSLNILRNFVPENRRTTLDVLVRARFNTSDL